MFEFELNSTLFEHVHLVPLVWCPFRLSWEVHPHFPILQLVGRVVDI